MGFLAGGFVDIDGYQLGKFKVYGLAGRDHAGVPRWEIVCPHHHFQVLAHRRLVAMLESKAFSTLQCTETTCPLSRSQENLPETAEQFNRRMKREAAIKAQAEAERQKAAEVEAAKQDAKQAAIEKLRPGYIEFWTHQLWTNNPESTIPSFKRWIEIGERTRQTILDSIRKEPDAKWKF